jgi:hypothetical protein
LEMTCRSVRQPSWPSSMRPWRGAPPCDWWSAGSCAGRIAWCSRIEVDEVCATGAGNQQIGAAILDFYEPEEEALARAAELGAHRLVSKLRADDAVPPREGANGGRRTVEPRVRARIGRSRRQRSVDRIIDRLLDLLHGHKRPHRSTSPGDLRSASARSGAASRCARRARRRASCAGSCLQRAAGLEKPWTSSPRSASACPRSTRCSFARPRRPTWSV